MPHATTTDSLLVIKEITDPDELQMALTLERDIFEACDFVSMDEYEKFLPQSIFFGAFDIDGCAGMVRLITPGQHLPPFMGPSVEISTDRDALTAQAHNGELWEFATAAIRPDRRSSPVFLSLVRAAYRRAHSEGVRFFGAMMDPRRAVAQNRLYQLHYRRVGPNQHYMGEPDVNAPFVMSFDEMDERTRAENPAYMEWILEGDDADLRMRPNKAKVITIDTQNELIDLRDGAEAEAS